MSTAIQFTPLATDDPSDSQQATLHLDPLHHHHHNNNDSGTTTSTRSERKPALPHHLQQVTDRAISKLGPLLLTAALLLLSVAVFCFFTVFFPYHYVWQPDQGLIGNLAYILHLIWSCYLVWCIAGNYYYAVRTPPGGVLDGLNPMGDDVFQDVLLQMEYYTPTPPTCKRCHLPKPERAHHCSVCKRCVLRYDHHCPWINNCVGHYNHRFFLLFLTYLATACVYFVIMGASPFLLAADTESDNNWPYWLDRTVVAFCEILAVAIGFAVGGMAIWHWYLALTAQTTLEQYNNSYMRRVCRKRGDTFSNMYDFGIVGNFLDLFNIGPRGHYPWYTALFPLPIPPIGDGKRYKKSGRGYVLEFDVEEEEDDDDMV